MAPVLIIGAGINGLVCAFYLARAGVRVQLLERRGQPGGCLVTGTMGAGVSVPTLSHTAGPLHPQIVQDAGLSSSLGPVGPSAQLCVLGERGALKIEDDRRAAIIGGGLPSRDASRLQELVGTVHRMAAILRPLLTTPPPSVDAPTWTDLIALLTTGRRLRGLGRQDAFRLMQWAPMPIADLAEEWFDDDALRAAVAARGIFGRAAGPKSAWTTLELLMHAALTERVVVNSHTVAGGPGAVIAALVRAATAAGATLRTDADVARIDVANGRATGVTLTTGETIAARAVVSSADPRRTFLDWVDSVWLGPEFVSHVANFRSRGVLAKVNLALAGLPAFSVLGALDGSAQRSALSGRIQVGSTLEWLERAYDDSKYGRYSTRPYLDVSIPTLSDPSLAPEGQHVLSAYMQFAPRELRHTTWASERDRLGDLVVATLDAHAPGLASMVTARHVLTPEDLERDYALSGGHIFHGEHAVDQLFVLRPVYGWAHYRTPVEHLFLCGAGTHPGGGATGTNGLVASKVIAAALGR